MRRNRTSGIILITNVKNHFSWVLYVLLHPTNLKHTADARTNNVIVPLLLSKEQLSIANDAICGEGMPDDKVAVSGPNKVTRSSMQTLKPKQWLNDEVINYYIKICLAERDKNICSSTGRKRSYFFNSFFMQKLFDEKNSDVEKRGKFNYDQVTRWSGKVREQNLFQMKYVFAPINLDNTHWTLAVIFMEEKRIQYYDSKWDKNKIGSHFLHGLLDYLKQEYLKIDTLHNMDTTGWMLVSRTDAHNTPWQENGEFLLQMQGVYDLVLNSTFNSVCG